MEQPKGNHKTNFIAYPIWATTDRAREGKRKNLNFNAKKIQNTKEE
jgi:hypothetical protein